MTRPTPSQSIILFAMALILALSGLTGWQIWRSRITERERTGKELTRLNSAHADQTANAIRAVELALQTTYDFRTTRFNEKLVDRDAHLRLQGRIQALPYVIEHLVFDSDGQGIVSSRHYPMEKTSSVNNQKYFNIHKQSPNAGLYISAPVKDRLTGAWDIFLTRRLNGPNGEFKGVVAAAIDSGYFARLYEKANRGAAYRTLLIHADGTLLAGTPHIDASIGRSLATGMLFTRYLPQSSQGLLTAPSLIDDEDRIVSFTRLEQYPLVVTQSIAEKDAFATWKSDVTVTLLKLFFGIGAILVLMWQLVRNIKSLEQSEKTVRADQLELFGMKEQLEQLVAQRTAKLEASVRELDAFCYSVSHDLRTPLRSITSFSQILAQRCHDKLDEKELDYFNRIVTAGQQMGSLIDALLKLSRVSRHELKRENIDISALAGKIITEFKNMEPERNIQVSIAPNLTAYGDPRLLELALYNLIHNAWKYTSKRDPATIEIGGEDLDQEKKFFIRDNGTGFDMAYSNKLFKTFERLHDLQEFEGLGVGLAEVYRIIEAHNGRAWAESTLGEGATFYFVL